MYIQEIIIDGFKSYAQKTVVSGFDPMFNAITGLNGTGKSNILDSICFVLGIQNLSQVRAGNLQELVYKQGQAGVTKASVTIIFNNNDVASSPIGYESHKQITVTRQVVIGGKNKYIINGHTVQQSQVANLFHSVQLNVNNPHFLIMQGRITKVLNMKPIEILSMIEEAAGTRMFETKKQAAIKTIEKKQLKVDEITKCMDEEITPTLDNLRSERVDYHTWQANNSEFERLERFCVAFEFCEADDKIKSSEADRDSMKAEHDALVATEEEKQSAAQDCESRIDDIVKQRDSEVEGELHQLKTAEADLSKKLVKVSALSSNMKDNIASEAETMNSLMKQVDEAASQIEIKKVELDKSNQKLEQKEAEVAAADKEHSALKEKHQNAIAGVADESNADCLFLPEQVGTWEKKEREALSGIRQCQQRIDHFKESASELRKTNKAESKSHTSAMQEMEKLRVQISEYEGKLAKMTTSEADETVLRSRVAEMRTECSHMKDSIDTMTAAVEARLNFEFKDPEKGFDRSKVKGLVAKLVHVDDARTTTALEITAGAKLYQVVVDTENTGKQILQKGQLRKRVTILPLNKINAHCTDANKMKRAQQIAKSMGGTATLALELVGFEEEVRKAIEYVFGSSIICDNADVAKAIAYDKNIRTRTVTLDGDSFDPAGTMTGGSKNQLGLLLSKMHELHVLEEQFAIKNADLKAADKQLTKMEAEVSAARDIIEQLEIKKIAMTHCENKLAETTYAQTMAKIADYESQLVALDAEIVTLKEQHTNAKEKLKELKLAEKNIKAHREQAMKKLETDVKASQKSLSALKTECNALKNKRDALIAEIKGLEKDSVSIKEQYTICEKGIVRLNEEAATLDSELALIRSAYDEAKAAMTAKTQEINSCNKEIKALEKEKDKYLKESQNASLEARKLSHKLKQWEKDFKEASKVIASLIKANPWIETERAMFGQTGSDFDFKARNPTQSTKRLKQLKADQERLSKKINKKVMGMIENAEREYEELNRKREVILNDKAKIESVIEELDIKKTQSLQSTWLKVNKDFGSIFSMLLPGTTAKLEPPEGQTVSEGLEVKVAFNGTWKDSLTELSGGQRSLLALSLILALLLFKPAPMYILDEVDAALDLSHTQNIGMMLRTHFQNSQFIVVSLKEGMFNNANVIFRTKFVDGISAVTRTVPNSKPQKASNMLLTNHQQEEDAESAPQKKKGKTASKSRGVAMAGSENLVH